MGPYGNICKNLEVSGTIIEANGSLELSCGEGACQKMLLGIMPDSLATVGIVGLGNRALFESRVDIDVTYSQEVQMNLTCGNGGCRRLKIDASTIDITGCGSFVGKSLFTLHLIHVFFMRIIHRRNAIIEFFASHL